MTNTVLEGAFKGSKISLTDNRICLNSSEIRPIHIKNYEIITKEKCNSVSTVILTSKNNPELLDLAITHLFSKSDDTYLLVVKWRDGFTGLNSEFDISIIEIDEKIFRVFTELGKGNKM